MRTMYYILQDFRHNPIIKRHRLMLGMHEVLLSKDILYAAENIYILPQNNGTYMIAGREFVRNDRGIFLKKAESY